MVSATSARLRESAVTERRMHLVRWALTTGWLLIILSLLYDPFTPRFTAPTTPGVPCGSPPTA